MNWRRLLSAFASSNRKGPQMDRECKHCGGKITVRNPRGDCDHLYWPDMLTDEAKRANGYAPVEQRTIGWMKTGVTPEEMIEFLAGASRDKF